MQKKASVAVLIPSKNEATSITKVITEFRKVLPNAKIYVGDNNSTDDTAIISRNLGCEVVFEVLPGKGNILRRLFKEINADYYVIVDGDNTYDAKSVIKMYKKILDLNLDMVVARRIHLNSHIEKERQGHHFGNKIINKFFNLLFHSDFKDILSGYRIVSSNFIDSFPSKSLGFEIEVELHAHAVLLGASVSEVDSNYIPRADSSESKLRTFRDGARIIKSIINLNRNSLPIRHFFIFYTPIGLIAVSLILRAIIPYTRTGNVANFPSLIVGTSLFLLTYLIWSSFLMMEHAISNHLTLLNLLQRNSRRFD